MTTALALRAPALLAEPRAAQLHVRRAQPAESRALSDWIAERHYSGSAPAGFRVALEFLLADSRIGAMLLGRPTARMLDAREWLEVTRIYFVDDTPPHVESRALALMRKFVRAWMPEVRCLLSYSDPEEGHDGTIYRADGWACFGRTRNSTRGFGNRPGRREGAPSRKLRWVRTP